MWLIVSSLPAVSLLEAINNSFGLYLLSCLSARISYLFGQKRNEECAQVFVDIIRISIIMLNICKPLTKWFGADEHIQNMGFQYLIPITGLTIFYEMYQICCGLLQSEGLSWIYGVCQYFHFSHLQKPSLFLSEDILRMKLTFQKKYKSKFKIVFLFYIFIK